MYLIYKAKKGLFMLNWMPSERLKPIKNNQTVKSPAENWIWVLVSINDASQEPKTGPRSVAMTAVVDWHKNFADEPNL